MQVNSFWQSGSKKKNPRTTPFNTPYYVSVSFMFSVTPKITLHILVTTLYHFCHLKWHQNVPQFYDSISTQNILPSQILPLETMLAHYSPTKHKLTGPLNCFSCIIQQPQIWHLGRMAVMHRTARVGYKQEAKCKTLIQKWVRENKQRKCSWRICRFDFGRFFSLREALCFLPIKILTRSAFPKEKILTQSYCSS